MIRRILHATDFSSASRAAFAKAIELTKSNRAELLLVHVIDRVLPFSAEGYISPAAYTQIEKSTRASTEKQLTALVKQAAKAKVRARTLVLEGTVSDAIVAAAKSKRADLIVMGTHGRTGLSGLFLGSVAGRVVATASCPVLTVRGKSSR